MHEIQVHASCSGHKTWSGTSRQLCASASLLCCIHDMCHSLMMKLGSAVGQDSIIQYGMLCTHVCCAGLRAA
jgi:hypothetical protein